MTWFFRGYGRVHPKYKSTKDMTPWIGRSDGEETLAILESTETSECESFP